MQVNKKKSITLRNRTTYFNPDTCKVKVTFSSPESYQSRQIKIEGYETRLYWQYRYCDDHNGQTFFYTLTYNDKAMPKYFVGMKYDNEMHTKEPEYMSCFDYEDLRDLLTGGFRKKLLRKYGTTFKYFIGAELGDGKGERGMHNNPHYHVLFFLEPANNPRYPYVRISPEDFRHLVRVYWQGFDEDEGRVDYRDAKYGICREGENTGLVTDFRACMYCAKYVCKDVKLKQGEHKVEKMLRYKNKKEKFPEECCRRFFFERIVPIYNTLHNRTPQEVMDHLNPEFFDLDRILDGDDYDVNTSNLDSYDAFSYEIPAILRKRKGLWKKYWKFYKEWLDEKVRLGVNEYRNRYCNKCRISNGVGDYALEHIDDPLNPIIQVPSKKGFKNRPLSMHYYRKLFTEVHIDEEGSPIRVLNELGIQYKLSRLSKQIDKMTDKSYGHLQIVLNNPVLYDKMKKSDVNTRVFASFAGFSKNINYLLNENNIDEILKRYAEYKLIYEDRFFAYQPDTDGDVVDFPDVSPYDDYHRFLIPSYYSTTRSDDRISLFVESNCKGYLPYSMHPYFLRYLGLFSVLDLCADYFFVQGDDKAQQDAEEIAATKRFHDREKLKEFYSVFGLA